MDLYDVLDQVVVLLQWRSRVTYNALKLQCHRDDEQLAVLKDELLYAHPQVVDDAVGSRRAPPLRLGSGHTGPRA